jgi:thioesterase domain-containing protein
VAVREDAHENKRLVAYVTASGPTIPERGELQALLKQMLPDYMVPADYVVLESIPLTPNGKVDRSALPAPEPAVSTESCYVPPRDEFERLICDAWAEVLGLQRVGIRDNFFDLGGHSLLAVQLMRRLQKIIPGEPLPLKAVLEAPTVERFAVWLRRHKSEHYQYLVRMRQGTPDRVPFFCVHGGGGNVLYVRPLAMALPDSLPVYCLQAKGLDGSKPFETVEETARAYLDEIRKVQAHGPFHLGGICYGGLVAFEMARAIEEAGETVALLALMDSYNPAFSGSLGIRERFFRKVRFYGKRVFLHIGRMFSLRPRVWREYIGGRLRALRKHVRGSDATPVTGAQASHFEEVLKRVRESNRMAGRRYVPMPYSGGAIIFRASRRKPFLYEDEMLGWRQLVRGPLECFEIEGDHDSIFENPAVQLIAEKIDEKLRSHGRN